jgi:hypothetical protein
LELTEAKFSDYDPDHPNDNPVLSLKMNIVTQPIETYHVTITPNIPNCGEPGPDYDIPFWFAGFQVEHPDFSFPGVDFVRDTAPVFALAVYSPHTIGPISENTLVEIVHTPEALLPVPDPTAN